MNQAGARYREKPGELEPDRTSSLGFSVDRPLNMRSHFYETLFTGIIFSIYLDGGQDNIFIIPGGL